MIRRIPLRHRRRHLLVLLLTGALALGATVAASSARAATPPHTPFGHVDSAAQVGASMRVTGWAIDPDTTAPIHVDIYADGRGLRRLTADIPRPDVARIFPGRGTNHGYSFSVAMAAGTHRICAYAINAGAGSSNPLLGCRTVTLTFRPYGALDSVLQSPGSLTAQGWAIDGDQPKPSLAVKLVIDGVVASSGTANLSRPDIAARHPEAGVAHGYALSGAVTEGTHQVCVAATNIGLGTDAQVGCRTVAISFSPAGAITALSQAPGGFRVSGWAKDPDTATAIQTTISADGTTLGTVTANGASTAMPGHGFAAAYRIGSGMLAPGVHNICVIGVNAGTYGHNRTVACRSITLNFNPSAAITAAKQKSPGIQVSGWAQDPDTATAVHVLVTVDGVQRADVIASAVGTTHSGHNFTATVPATNGQHKVCVVAVNLVYGNGNSSASCATLTLNFNPFGHLDGLRRATGSTNVVVGGWAIDPDTANPISVAFTVDGTAAGQAVAKLSRPDVARAHPGWGSLHGYSATVAANELEHKVCATALNVGGGTGNTSLGCQIINAVHPKVPSAPRSVTARGGYGGATVSWVAPASDGGAPWSVYKVTASPSGISVTVGPRATTATVTGLKANTSYVFSVQARNIVGLSPAGASPAVRTQSSPPPQTSPAPISTSRYIRNVTGGSSTDLAKLRAEGAADAAANPTGHGYLILLDIGGQDQADGGVVLSATTRFISYANLVSNLKAYVDGYASRQRPSAPVTIALGTNNDMDVTAAAGAAWARGVVNPVRSYAAKYIGMTVAGANDIEPGFRGTYTQTKAWLAGYLGATAAPFVFNGSADGCAWAATNRGCNNGWTMAGLYNLAAGAAPTRIVNLPQIYNNTMAAQWKYISLTGVTQSRPKINFGGALTEWTACAQTGSCGSLTGNVAWTQMWNQLQSHPALRVGSLPYSTDLRIDR
jgi:hypothetical protein